jgi:hypothetical protein
VEKPRGKKSRATVPLITKHSIERHPYKKGVGRDNVKIITVDMSHSRISSG